MPFFKTTRFEGMLSGHGRSIPISFDVTVDDLGVLQLSLDRIPFSREAYALRVNQRPGTAVDLIALQGRSEQGHVFRSDSFHIGPFNHGPKPGEELSYQGDCYDAELELPPREGLNRVATRGCGGSASSGLSGASLTRRRSAVW